MRVSGDATGEIEQIDHRPVSVTFRKGNAVASEAEHTA